MSTITSQDSSSPDMREVTWLADALSQHATDEHWQSQQWSAAQTVLECLISDQSTPPDAQEGRPVFALYALTLCKDAVYA